MQVSIIAGAVETEHAETNAALTVRLPVWVPAQTTPLNASEPTAAANKPIFCFLSIIIASLPS